jgi:hypothetical protein
LQAADEAQRKAEQQRAEAIAEKAALAQELVIAVYFLVIIYFIILGENGEKTSFRYGSPPGRGMTRTFTNLDETFSF